MRLRSYMRKGKIETILIVILIIFFAQNVLAEWNGPMTILTGSWGNEPDEFHFVKGEIEAGFPREFGVNNEGDIFINDKGNNVIKIFDLHGKLKKIISPPSDYINPALGSWVNEIYVHPSGGFVVSYQGSQKFIFSINYKFIKKIDVHGKAIPCTEGYYFKVSRTEYHLYSKKGELLNIHNGQLLIEGKISTGYNSDGQAIKKFTYSDHLYEVHINHNLEEYYRDIIKNLYVIEEYFEKIDEKEVIKYEQYKVHRYDICKEDISIFTMPLSLFEPTPPEALNRPTWISDPIIEYGEPIISNNGDLYCWARTKDEYRILKWTWQEEADSPRSLLSSSSTDSVTLSWEVPGEDIDKVKEYEIVRSTDVCGPFDVIGTVKKDTLMYVDKEVKRGETYYYKVRAVKEDGYSGYSNKAVGNL